MLGAALQAVALGTLSFGAGLGGLLAASAPEGVRLLAEAPQGKAPHAVLALGALVRGETPHFDHLAATITRALEQICARTGVPVANAVLTCDTLEQAMERAGGKGGNKGFEAALTAIEMANLRRSLTP